MEKKYLKILSLMICFSMIFTMTVQAAAYTSSVSSSELKTMISDTSDYLYKTVSNPQVSSIGGEWTILSLARSCEGESKYKEYFEKYYDNVVEYVKSCKGVLSEKKYTEYSRVIIALTAIGKDPTNVAGYDLTLALGDYEKTIYQGINGAVWALIALDCGSYEIPVNSSAKTQATRELYIKKILDSRLSDGGWAFSGDTSDPDLTGMVLQALSNYTDRKDVSEAVEAALSCMSEYQLSNGGFSSWGTENAESCAQMLTALCELGISPDDSRFVKNGNSMLTNLKTFYNKGNGFNHVKDGSGAGAMATEQCLYALVAAERFYDGKSSLYDMSESSNENSDSAALDLQKSVLKIAGYAISLGAFTLYR